MAVAVLIAASVMTAPAAGAQRHRHRQPGVAFASQPIAPGSFERARMIDTSPGHPMSAYERSREMCSPL
jgi:hypothetical protein